MDKEKKHRGERLRAGLLAFVFLMVASCGGNSSSSGPPPPLPNDLTGSISPTNNTLANCYISDISACSSNPTGTNPITALAAATIGSTNFLYWGDGGGDIYFYQNPTSTPPSLLSSNNCGSVSTKILSLAVVPSSSPPELFYATSGGTFEASLPTTGGCPTTSLPSTPLSNAGAGSLAYNSGFVIGVTGSAQYFSCTTASTPSCTSFGTLPGLVDTSPQITAIASDPQYAIVYVLAIGINTGRIYAYQVSSSGTLTYLTNYSGTELNAPSGLALFQGQKPTQNFCTIGPCTFMDVTNSGNTTITQYVLTYSYSGTTPNGVSINQFNNAYFNCDLVNPGPIAALPLPSSSSGTLNNPDVFVGERGLGTVPCLGVSQSGSFGNNITAYTVNNE